MHLLFITMLAENVVLPSPFVSLLVRLIMLLDIVEKLILLEIRLFVLVVCLEIGGPLLLFPNAGPDFLCSVFSTT